MYLNLREKLKMEPLTLNTRDEKEIVSFVHTLPRPHYWELFATVTFRRPRGLFEASKAYRRWMDRTLPRVTHFWAIERNPSGDGGHHVHALWAGTEDLVRTEVWKKAFEQLGRTRIEPIKSNADVTMYCTKYAVKEGALIEWKLNKGCDYQRFLQRRTQL
jgi:hypothetical protein